MKSTTLWCALSVAACHHPQSPATGDAPMSDAPIVDAPPDVVDASPDAATPLGDPFGGLVQLPPACSSDGWCWWQPAPSGTFYNRIVSSSPANIWIVGGGPPGYAAILQWDGHVWTAHQPPVPPGYPACEFPMAVSTIGHDNTWLVYGNLVEHWDGGTWSIVYASTASGVTLNGVWVDPTGDAWVTASDGTVARWHGSTPTIWQFGSYMGSIWGTAPDDIFVTSVGSIFHFDGTAFSRIYSGGKTAAWYQGAPGDVWITGGDAAMLHWNGHSVTEVSAPAVPSHGVIQSAAFVSRSDVSWIATGATAGPTYLVHWDGAHLATTTIDHPANALGEDPCGLLGSAQVIDGAWWIVCADGGVATMIGAHTLAPVISPWTGIGSLWGTSTSDLYLATGAELRHWDGATWTTTPRQTAGLRGVKVNGGSVLFGVHTTGPTTFIDRFDGTSWTSTVVSSSGLVNSVYPLGPDEALLVGTTGSAYHYQAGVVAPIASGTTANLVDIFAPDGDHAWIAGDRGTLLQWDRSLPGIFTPDASFPATTDDLRAITGAGGLVSVIAANQNHAWMKPAIGPWRLVDTQVFPVSIAAINDHDVVVVGTDSGDAARWNGTSFVREVYPSWRGLQTLYALPDGTTYLSGPSGVIMHP